MKQTNTRKVEFHDLSGKKQNNPNPNMMNPIMIPQQMNFNPQQNQMYQQTVQNQSQINGNMNPQLNMQQNIQQNKLPQNMNQNMNQNMMNPNMIQNQIYQQSNTPKYINPQQNMQNQQFMMTQNQMNQVPQPNQIQQNIDPQMIQFMNMAGNIKSNRDYLNNFNFQPNDGAGQIAGVSKINFNYSGNTKVFTTRK